LLMIFWMVPLYTFFDIPSYNRPEGYTPKTGRPEVR
jgi:hypothetical protein